MRTHLILGIFLTLVVLNTAKAELDGDCDGVPYDSATHGCCDGNIYELGLEDCCDGVIYTVELQGCCDGEVYDKATEDCCNGVIYDKATQRCCGGSVYDIDPSKEESDCWEWSDEICDYECVDDEDPVISADSQIDVQLECSYSTAAIPDVGATASDNCDDDVDIEQEPAAGSGQYGLGSSESVTITATDDCGRSATVDVEVRFVCGDVEAPQISDDDISVELDCKETTVSLPDLASSVTDNCGVESFSQEPAAGTGQYGDGDSEAITVHAKDGCGNESTQTINISFEYICPEYDDMTSAKIAMLLAAWRIEEECAQARIYWRNFQFYFDQMREVANEVGLGIEELYNACIGAQMNPGDITIIENIGIDYIVDVIFPKIQ